MEWINNNSDALMVIITLVYVIATIFIWRANKISAQATKEQLEESKRQFDESQRQAKAELEESKRQFEVTKIQTEEQLNEQKEHHEESMRIQCMPFLQMEHQIGLFHDENFSMEFNLCKSEMPETIVRYFKLKNIGNGPAINLVYTLEYTDDAISDPMPICGIRSGDEYIIKIEFSIDEEAELLKPNIGFSYRDALGNEWEQRVTIVMDVITGETICENNEPR